jgi:hypothetical protein
MILYYAENRTIQRKETAMTDEDRYEVPEQSVGDAGHMALKAVTSMIPVLGGPAAEVFAFIIAPPLEKRQAEWMKSVADGLRTLEEKVDSFKIEELPNNESFVTTLLHATRIALMAHREEKRRALRNAVLNAALPNAPDDIQQKMFVEWLDELTEWHIKVLALFATADNIPSLDLHDPKWRMYMELDELSEIIETHYPEMRGHFDRQVQIIHDLHQKGFLVHIFPDRAVASEIRNSPSLSSQATAFLWFIKSPLDDE